MAKTNLSLVSYRAGDAECLKAFTDSGGSVGSLYAALLDSDSAAYGVSPLSVLKADRLNALYKLVDVKTFFLADVGAFFDRLDTVLFENCEDLLFSLSYDSNNAIFVYLPH